jgi:uroporphyrinogen-III decarboxylase
MDSETEYTDHWGITHRRMDYGAGAYMEQATFPLAAAKTGYILAPCHNIQPVTPIENIVAMYDEAHRYGQFR